MLTLGTVISTLAENAARGKSDHVPFRNSKLTRMLQPSLSGNARISVICTINPDASAIPESTSTLLFAQRIKKVQLHAQKKEVVDTDALLERYRKEIEELRKRLAEKEAPDGPMRGRRLSAREQLDESLAMHNLNARIKQLTKLILTSQTVDENKGDESRPASPTKVDFDMSPYQVRVLDVLWGHPRANDRFIAATRAPRGATRARDAGDPDPLARSGARDTAAGAP